MVHKTFPIRLSWVYRMEKWSAPSVPVPRL